MSNKDLNEIFEKGEGVKRRNTYWEIEPMPNSESFVDDVKEYIEYGSRADWAIVGGWSRKDNSDLEDNVERLTEILESNDIPVWHKDNLDFGYKKENPLWD